MTLDEARNGIGRWVVGLPMGGGEDRFGVIIRVGLLFAFVRWDDSDCDPYPVRPESIEFPVACGAHLPAALAVTDRHDEGSGK